MAFLIAAVFLIPMYLFYVVFLLAVHTVGAGIEWKKRKATRLKGPVRVACMPFDGVRYASTPGAQIVTPAASASTRNISAQGTAPASTPNAAMLSAATPSATTPATPTVETPSVTAPVAAMPVAKAQPVTQEAPMDEGIPELMNMPDEAAFTADFEEIPVECFESVTLDESDYEELSMEEAKQLPQEQPLPEEDLSDPMVRWLSEHDWIAKELIDEESKTILIPNADLTEDIDLIMNYLLDMERVETLQQQEDGLKVHIIPVIRDCDREAHF